MWSRLRGTAVSSRPQTQNGLPQAERALLSEWWAPAQPLHGVAELTEEERAVAAEWVAVGVSAPDPVVPEGVEVDLASMAEWSAPVLSIRKDPDLATLSEWCAQPIGAAPLQRSLALAEAAATISPAAHGSRVVRTRAEGTFSITGLALASGHLVFQGVSFPHRLSGTPRPEGVTLTISADQNIAPGGLVVMADSGFGPSDEGFTLVLAAAAPGRFHARGRYAVGVD